MSESKESAVLLTGVNVGYQGENVAVTDSSEAARIVQERLPASTSMARDTNEYVIRPGVVVYHTDWGCPKGGEAVAAVITNGDSSSAVKTAKNLRNSLNQTTLAVGSYDGKSGDDTTAFKATTQGDMSEIASHWQGAAAEFMEESKTPENEYGTYVSCGMYEAENGDVVIQAESNPEFNKDPKAWQTAVSSVAANAAARAGVDITPEFRDAGFTYLKEPEKEIDEPAQEQEQEGLAG